VSAPPWRPVADGIALRVRLTPKARRDRLDGLAALADGTCVVRAAVTAAPEDGKANAALLRLLAMTWRLPRTALAVTGGATSLLKTVTIRGDGQALAGMLNAWRAGLAAADDADDDAAEPEGTAP
jgi:uncharacterized protein YggU (UPF0235/DUF167 family)